MTIEKLTGSGKKKDRYFVVNEAGNTLAYFDSLDRAAVVLRFLKGAPMRALDADEARAAMMAFDTRKEGNPD